jgi:hypothetical protein
MPRPLRACFAGAEDTPIRGSGRRWLHREHCGPADISVSNGRVKAACRLWSDDLSLLDPLRFKFISLASTRQSRYSMKTNRPLVDTSQSTRTRRRQNAGGEGRRNDGDCCIAQDWLKTPPNFLEPHPKAYQCFSDAGWEESEISNPQRTKKTSTVRASKRRKQA